LIQQEKEAGGIATVATDKAISSCKSVHVRHSDGPISQNITAMAENAVTTKTGWEFVFHGETT